MIAIIDNLIAAAEKAKAEESAANHCKWCNAEIEPELTYCAGTDCEYDGEKWRRAHYE